MSARHRRRIAALADAESYLCDVIHELATHAAAAGQPPEVAQHLRELRDQVAQYRDQLTAEVEGVCCLGCYAPTPDLCACRPPEDREDSCETLGLVPGVDTPW